MLAIILAAAFLGGVIILILRESAPQVPYQSTTTRIHRLGELPASEKDVGHDTPQYEAFRNYPLKHLESFCRHLVDHIGLNFHAIDYHPDQEFHILATLERPFLRGTVIICGHLAPDAGVIDSSTVIGFSDMVKAERAMKGIFVTTGYFSEEVMKLNEGASIELIDIGQLAKLMAEWLPDLLPKTAGLNPVDSPED